MSQIPADRLQDPGWYEIRVRGHLDSSRWAAWFDGMTITPGAGGTTLIRGLVADQAALHGVLQKTRDLGLPLISVAHLGPGQTRLPPAAGAR